MAVITLDTLVPRGVALTGAHNVEPRLGASAKANGKPTALLEARAPITGRRPDQPARVSDAEYGASGTRRGAGRSLRLTAARVNTARIPPTGRCGETWRPGTGR
jgi:hypothetical protein